MTFVMTRPGDEGVMGNRTQLEAEPAFHSPACAFTSHALASKVRRSRHSNARKKNRLDHG